jgi:superoxide dismutase, Cu-Zn family
MILTVGVSTFGCDRDEKSDTPRVGAHTNEVRPAVTTGMLGAAATTGNAAHHADQLAPPAVTMGTTSPAASGTAASGTATSAMRADGDTDDRDNDAEAKFQSVPSMKIEGDADLEETAEGVKISIEVEHALPGQKGIHIHQTDNCTDIANKSMGEHFAPTVHKHGLPTAAEHHLGDLGNITIDKDGNGKLEITAVGANLKAGDPLSFIGKSIVIHESNDKGSGASGDAGKPIACAPIRAD